LIRGLFNVRECCDRQIGAIARFLLLELGSFVSFRGVREGGPCRGRRVIRGWGVSRGVASLSDRGVGEVLH
jgi:hypothetical protein